MDPVGLGGLAVLRARDVEVCRHGLKLVAVMR